MKKRVCVFCETWESGGIESFLTNVLTHMDLSELEIDLVAECIRESVFTPRLKECGVNFVELTGHQRSPRNAVVFRSLLRERRYGVVHLNLFQGLSLRYVAIAKREGVPCRIAHSHNTALRKSITKWLKLLLHNVGKQFFARKATDFWACSGAAADFMFPQGTDYVFIPNGIDTDRFRFDKKNRREVRDELGISDAFVIGHIGRLCYQKNQSFLLDVLAEVIKQKPEARLLFVGDGEGKDVLVEKANRLGIGDAVIFYGTTDSPEMLYCAMDIFAFPSRFEGLGIVAVEAQCSGLPVICSDNVPNEAYVLPSMQGISLQCGASAWAYALFECLNQSKERINCAEIVKDHGFDVVDAAEQMANSYKK